MKLVLLSDTHGERPEIPEGDLLIFAGDLTKWGSFAEVKQELAWLKSLPHTHKLMVSGNHDTALGNLYEADKEAQLRTFLHPIIYLRDSGAEIGGVRLFGSPWVPMGDGGVFTADSGELRTRFASIPDGLDVLITHCPPLESQRHSGSQELLEAVEKTKPRLHVFGHSHHAFSKTHDGITFVNATAQPIVFNFDLARNVAAV